MFPQHMKFVSQMSHVLPLCGEKQIDCMFTDYRATAPLNYVEKSVAHCGFQGRHFNNPAHN